MLRIWMSWYTWGNSKAKGKSQKFNLIKKFKFIYFKGNIKKTKKIFGDCFWSQSCFYDKTTHDTFNHQFSNFIESNLMWKLWAILIKNFKDVVMMKIMENLLDLHFTEAYSYQ